MYSTHQWKAKASVPSAVTVQPAEEGTANGINASSGAGHRDDMDEAVCFRVITEGQWPVAPTSYFNGYFPNSSAASNIATTFSGGTSG